MARTTLASLTAELSALREHLARREAEWESAQNELRALRSAPPARTAAAPAPARRASSYTAPAPTAEQLRYRAACARARELAMKTGRSVAVSSTQ